MNQEWQRPMHAAGKVLVKRFREGRVLRCVPSRLDVPADTSEHLSEAGRKLDSKLLLDFDQVRLGRRRLEDKRMRIKALARKRIEDQVETAAKIHDVFQRLNVGDEAQSGLPER